MDEKQEKVISIIGPTASGKTGLGIALAQALFKHGQAAEIISADAYQMYKGMDIGTAKATAEERALVPHHLIDILEPGQVMTVALFQDLARKEISDLQVRSVRPILVGGSGFYARAAIDRISFPGTDSDIRRRWEEEGKVLGPEALFSILREKDPLAASHMDEHNIRRTIRALEVIELTGRPYSASLPRYEYAIGSLQIGLDLSRQELDRRIDERTQGMRRAGFTSEVERIRPHLGPTAARALGYQQIIDFLDGLISEDEAYALIARKTRRLARKQMGWFGRDPRIHWLTATRPDLVEAALALVDHADAGDFDDQDAQADSFVQHHLGQTAA